MTGYRSSLLDHHHWIWIITVGSSSLDLDHHSIWVITAGSSSLDLDHHWLSSLDLDHHWCYLMILLIIGISTKPTLFHAGCRPSLHVGLCPALTSDLLVRKEHPTLTYDHVGTNPIIISERPSTHIHQRDRNSKYYHLWKGSTLTTTNMIGTQTTIIYGKAQHSHPPAW